MEVADLNGEWPSAWLGRFDTLRAAAIYFASCFWLTKTECTNDHMRACDFILHSMEHKSKVGPYFSKAHTPRA